MRTFHAADVEVNVPGLGKLVVDIAYGGNYYAVIEPQVGWPGLDGMTAGDVVDLSQKLRDALGTICDPVHPDDERIRGVHHAIWCDRPVSAEADGRGAVFYGDKAIDRSPGGTGTSARMAQLHGKGRLKAGETFRQESLIGARSSKARSKKRQRSAASVASGPASAAGRGSLGTTRYSLTIVTRSLTDFRSDRECSSGPARSLLSS
ncbi:hypothetical protein AGR8A_Lc20094 [Agrobacterium fabrum str. J-07]|nr:hypothetical protein AGR8A_Lc20094 [Agrobacterium fabrum str. J-07]